ncbi:PhoX family phosphatase [Alkalihalophilus sp. As8PL]|uniref:PhoX family phosphatase n=1 Tax=Alkalihalophilus sp. As8PL TaxID=3237103 RepID=A0AB39BQ80_9BACI
MEKVNMSMNRRKFLGYLGTGTAALAAASAGLGTLAPVAKAASTADHLTGFEDMKLKPHAKPHAFFKPIMPSLDDELILPEGFSYDVLAAYGDVINQNGDTFGFNCDFTIFFPINESNERGLLWVNLEYVNDAYMKEQYMPAFMQGTPIDTKRRYHQGGAIIEVFKDNKGNWKMDTSSKYARRINGFTEFDLVGQAAGSSAIGGQTKAVGTWANCSGGMTLWNTLLSCEENFETQANRSNLPSEHYGWVVEVDPFDENDENFKPCKHTSLGRFNHENTCMGITKSGRIAVYMGDDKTNACVYKYISNSKFDPAKGKANSKLLEDGALYVANLQQGRWVKLDAAEVAKRVHDTKFSVPNVLKMRDQSVQSLRDMFPINATQAHVMVNTHEAAIILGGTPTDRPEDLEINPFDHSIFIAHTNNAVHGNIHGHITRIFEKEDDFESMEFMFEIFAAGGRQSGFSAPDNLTFDSDGNLWVVTDMSESNIGKGVYEWHGNNGLFVLPTHGQNEGEAFQFASGPQGCELTGPWFTADEKALFLAVQHPTTNWPRRKGDVDPLPAVVAIKGFKGNNLDNGQNSGGNNKNKNN